MGKPQSLHWADTWPLYQRARPALVDRVPRAALYADLYLRSVREETASDQYIGEVHDCGLLVRSCLLAQTHTHTHTCTHTCTHTHTHAHKQACTQTHTDIKHTHLRCLAIHTGDTSWSLLFSTWRKDKGYIAPGIVLK